MAESSTLGTYDVCFVVDSTGSMHNFWSALQKALPELLSIFRIVGNIDRVAVLAYGDYPDMHDLLRWSGWHRGQMKDLADFVLQISRKMSNGHDTPEAVRTAANHLLEKLLECNAQSQSPKQTIVIWYADAPPHSEKTGSYPKSLQAEKDALGENFDWLVLCKKLGAAGTIVFPVISGDDKLCHAYYALMSAFTGGSTLILSSAAAIQMIAQNTISLFLALANQGPSEFTKCSLIGVDPSVLLADSEVAALVGAKDTAIFRLDRNFTAAQIPPLAGNTGAVSLVKRFETDEKYKTLVYQVLDEVVDSSAIVSLTYNPLFGSVWRALCKDRTDPRRESLLARLSARVSTMEKAEEKNAIKEFLEKSYLQLDVIAGLLEQETSAPGAGLPGVALDTPANMASADFLELGRSCSSIVLSRISKLLTGMLLVTEPPAGTANPYIPLSMDDRQFFGLLPHLISPGLMISFRTSVVLAMLIVLSKQSLLAEKSSRFVRNSRGRWFNAEHAENFSYEFIKFVLKVDAAMEGEALTAEEREMFKRLHVIGGLKSNELATLQLKVPFSAHKTTRPDYKQPCSRCNEPRSFTLISSDGVCGLCLTAEEGEEVAPSTGADSSSWCECRTCAAHYAVEQVLRLNVLPKCHFCRQGEKAPVIECISCQNKFIYALAGERPSGWVCPPCKGNGGTPLPDEEVEMQLSQYPTFAFLGLDITDRKQFFAARSIWGAMSLTKDVSTAASAEGSGKPSTAGSVVENPASFGVKKIVKNVPELEAEILDRVRREKLDLGTCMLCFEDKPKRQLSRVCGRSRCSVSACTACLTAWYGQPQPGAILHESNLLCPFCKQLPGFKRLARFNRELGALKCEGPFDASWTYAWCRACYRARQYLERVCYAEEGAQAPTVQNWVCEDCTPSAGGAKEVLAKECPNPECGVMVHRTSGCDHITCACGTHWCYACRYVSTADEIYEHMWSTHGHIGLEANPEEDEYVDEDYE